jgi:VanZ family protein
MIKFLKLTYYISIFVLIIISLFPGSIIGFLLYGDWHIQPNLIKNPFDTTINHFICYFFVSLLGLSISSNSKKITYFMFFLSLILEFFHLIVPNRSFEMTDLVANILGVLVAYSFVKIYLLINKK